MKTVRSNPALWMIALVALVIGYFTTLQPRFGSPPAWAQYGFGNSWAGTATGSGNNYIVNIANMDSYHAGYAIRFIANLPNTGPATMQVQNLSGLLSAQNIYKPGPTGPVALSGGEIQPGAEEAFYDGAEFVLTTQQSPIIAGAILDWSGPFPPAGWLVAGGQAVSRTTYSALFNNTTIQLNGTVNATTTVTGLSSTAGFEVGYPISGTDVLAGTTVTSIDSGTQIHISQAATGSGTYPLVVAPNGVGDGATTFGVIDLRGRVGYGKDDMNGSASNRITTGGSGLNGVQIGAGGGNQANAIPNNTNYLPYFVPSGTIGGSQTITGIYGNQGSGAGIPGGGGDGLFSATINGSSFGFSGNSIGSTTPSAFPTLGPGAIVYKIVKY